MARCDECRKRLDALNRKHGKILGKPPIKMNTYAKELLELALREGSDRQLVLRATNQLYLLTKANPINTWIPVSSVIAAAEFSPENGNGLWYYRTPLVDPAKCPKAHIRADGIVEKRTANPIGIWERARDTDEIRLNEGWIGPIGLALNNPKIKSKLQEYSPKTCTKSR